MTSSDHSPEGPDLIQGIPLTSIPPCGMIAGHVDGSPALLVQLEDGLYACSGSCTHYGAPLAEGMFVADEVRCPWHHACFNIRTGEALHAPAFSPLTCWQVEVIDGIAYVRAEHLLQAPSPPHLKHPRPESIVIIGGGAAGYAAAHRLRELGYPGTLTLLSADTAAPYDRPNLSKDYLAGTAQEDWMPLQGPEYYAEQKIDLHLACSVTAIDPQAHEVIASNGDTWPYDALLIATGAQPRRVSFTGSERPEVFVLRSMADAQAIIKACQGATTVALVGAGFIGMEAAAALRSRGLDVHVIAPEAVPMAYALGNELGNLLTALHQEHGVVFHLGCGVTDFDGKHVTLTDGTSLAAQLLIVGTGVAPCTELAAAAGLAVDNGILVDAHLQTSAAGIFAAGDVARYPHGNERIRVEHWVHAQRQGQTAAANMLGAGMAFTDVPFFWTHHHGLELRCTGFTGGWDAMRIQGDLAQHDFTARFFRATSLVAAVSAGRDLENLAIEAALRD
ncbi:3-phenylpropionate/cinnamic acid dioxygenase ferredoxin--NAD(+) reductase component [compost metagenome]